MNPNILHVGLDVDDTQYHGSAFNRETGEVIDFRCRPAGAVLRQWAGDHRAATRRRAGTGSGFAAHTPEAVAPARTVAQAYALTRWSAHWQGFLRCAQTAMPA
jgi:hypothetical protein